MSYPYETFVLRKLANERIFVVNAKMPFENFIDCFYLAHPFFMVSTLDDGRVVVTPNPTVVPLSLFQAGLWPRDLFPTEWEYVTIKDETYPVIMTAHPVPKFDEWLRLFEKNVIRFAKETLVEYINTSKYFLPLLLETENYKKYTKPMVKEAITT